MSTSNKIAALSIGVSILGISLVIVERAHHGWWPFLSAGVEEFASRFSNCLQTRVGPRGTLLSGGEKQRISIARALLKNAPILLLDEVNSALDPLNDQIVQEAIRSQGHDKTIICITHRMHTAQSADKVLYLNRGQISSEKN